MYAVIEAGGKQHKVELGQVLEIDLMQEESGWSMRLKMSCFMSMEMMYRLASHT